MNPLSLRTRTSVCFVALIAASMQALPAAAHADPTTAEMSGPSIPTFRVRTFTTGSTNLYNPDGIVVTGKNVYVVYQNNSDHVNGVPSVIVKYSRGGVLQGQVALLGRCDGLRMDPYTNLLWALFNNDGLNGKPKRQPKLYTIDPNSMAATLYRFPKIQPHGGGYDDMAFANGKAFMSASSETLGPHGINNKPAVLEVTLSAGQANITPIVYGNTYGYDINTKTFERLNITDPDSMMVDSGGNVVLDSQGDAQLIFIRHAGKPDQSVSRLGVGTQLDDSAWTSGASGTLWVADASVNAIYAVASTFPAGTIFSEAPLASPVTSFVGALDANTGSLTPLLTERDGVINPTSLVFEPGA